MLHIETMTSSASPVASIDQLITAVGCAAGFATAMLYVVCCTEDRFEFHGNRRPLQVRDKWTKIAVYASLYVKSVFRMLYCNNTTYNMAVAKPAATCSAAKPPQKRRWRWQIWPCRRLCCYKRLSRLASNNTGRERYHSETCRRFSKVVLLQSPRPTY
ncbi:hypothetical protein F4861DRAFT_305606 [Xylaria intraflava]|nr:hypothetical protein F4861DRAFT_305606 [Xylaria intraflava]